MNTKYWLGTLPRKCYVPHHWYIYNFNTRNPNTKGILTQPNKMKHWTPALSWKCQHILQEDGINKALPDTWKQSQSSRSSRSGHYINAPQENVHISLWHIPMYDYSCVCVCIYMYIYIYIYILASYLLTSEQTRNMRYVTASSLYHIYIYVCVCIVQWSHSHNRPWRPIGLWGAKDPTLFRKSAHKWR
jgi:hypothetical protein